MGKNFVSIIEAVKELAKNHPEEFCLRFIGVDGNLQDSRTYEEIYNRASQIAFSLIHEYKLKKEDRVTLVYKAGVEFVEGFLGCLFAGVIPVPVPAPSPLLTELGLPAYLSIVNDCKPRAQLTSTSYCEGRVFSKLKEFLKQFPDVDALPFINTDLLKGDKLQKIIDPSKKDIAFLQYTSGSTSAPKGVCTTFENLAAQTFLYQEHFKTVPGTITAFWMPHYHDFTLIGGMVPALYGTTSLVYCSPESFLRRPAIWGDMMHEYKATTTGSPNFGFHLIAAKATAEEIARWDFSHLISVVSGGEPVSPKTVDYFHYKLKETGLDPKSYKPSYGLAEHTIAITMCGKKRFEVDRSKIESLGVKGETSESGNTVTLVGCGAPATGVTVKIVDLEKGLALKDEEIGEIWADSANKGAGYFGKTELSKQKFHAKLPGDNKEYLRTGDLGMFIQGELVILGRVDDVIILRGKNIYPQDIEELSALAHSLVKPGRTLAFRELDQVVLLVELKERDFNTSEYEEVASTLKKRLASDLGKFQTKIIFIPVGSIPKTTSGKHQRQKAKRLYQDKKLDILKTCEV